MKTTINRLTLHLAEAGDYPAFAQLTRQTRMRIWRKTYAHLDEEKGTAELKDAIVAKFKRENSLDYQRDQILVSTGAKQTIYNLVMSVIDPGDEAIIPAPYWVSYPDIVMLADGVPVFAKLLQ